MKCKILEIIFEIIKNKECNPERIFSLIEEFKQLEESGGC